MFKITSRFYVIYGDGVPIYVGYTNRTVKQRFAEHKEDKGFSDYEDVHVKELKKEKLVYEFTWDYGQTCKNADEVSLREGQLVQKFGTQDSVYQKAIGGGQSWNHEKWFVKSNKDNPKYKGMATSEIKRLLNRDKRIGVWLSNFVGGQRPDKEVWLNHFVNDQRPDKEVWLSNFVNNQRPGKEVWLRDFIGSQRPRKEVWLSHFVNDQRPKKEVWLRNFVNDQRPEKEVWLSNFVNNQRPKKEVWLSNFIGHQRPGKEVWLSNFVNNQRPKKEVWLSNFVGNQK